MNVFSSTKPTSVTGTCVAQLAVGAIAGLGKLFYDQLNSIIGAY